jgi:hypothetical protein
VASGGPFGREILVGTMILMGGFVVEIYGQIIQYPYFPPDGVDRGIGFS